MFFDIENRKRRRSRRLPQDGARNANQPDLARLAMENPPIRPHLPLRHFRFHVSAFSFLLSAFTSQVTVNDG
jgi:hypothetical protein